MSETPSSASARREFNVTIPVTVRVTAKDFYDAWFQGMAYVTEWADMDPQKLLSVPYNCRNYTPSAVRAVTKSEGGHGQRRPGK